MRGTLFNVSSSGNGRIIMHLPVKYSGPGKSRPRHYMRRCAGDAATWRMQTGVSREASMTVRGGNAANREVDMLEACAATLAHAGLDVYTSIILLYQNIYAHLSAINKE